MALNGRKGRVTVGSDAGESVILELNSWSLDISADEIDASVFGSEWGKNDVGIKKWSGSASGFLAPGDTTGQCVLQNAFESGDLLSDIKFYAEWSNKAGEVLCYYAPNLTADPDAGVRVTSVSPSVEHNGLAAISFSFSGSGPVKLFSETVE